MKKLILLFALLMFVPMLVPSSAEAGFFSDLANDIKKGWDDIKHGVESLADEVGDIIKKGVKDLEKLTAKVYDYVMGKLDDLLNDLIRKLEGDDGYKGDSFKHHVRRSGTGKIQIIANNSAKITAIGGLNVGLKIGWKGFSHTFHISLGKPNNQINYNTVVFPSTDISGWDIYIDSKTSGTHHYIGIDVNVASLILAGN